MVTPDRVYRLETYEDSDKNVSQWMHIVAEWVEYIDFRRKRQKKLEASVNVRCHFLNIHLYTLLIWCFRDRATRRASRRPFR